MKKLILILAVVLGSVWFTPQPAESRPNKPNHYNEIDEDSNAAYFTREAERQRNIGTNTQQSSRSSRIKKNSTNTYNNDLINKASRYIGANASQLGLPTRLWCADFMNMLTKSGTDRRAVSYVKRGRPASHGCVNCIAVTKRKGGGHVGIVKGYDSSGNPIIISGNHGRRVGVGVYARYKVIAYRYV